MATPVPTTDWHNGCGTLTTSIDGEPVIAYVDCTDISSVTFATLPEPRNRSTIGVGEEVLILWKEGKAEEVEWKLIKKNKNDKNNGKLSPFLQNDIYDNATITDKGSDTDTGATQTKDGWKGKSVWFIAGDEAGDVTIEGGNNETITFTIVPPSDWKLKRISTVGRPTNPAQDTYGDIGAAWIGKFYVQPNSVNFYRIELREEDSTFQGDTSDSNWLNSTVGKVHGGYTTPDGEGHFVSDWAPFDFYTDEGSAMRGVDHVGGLSAVHYPHPDGPPNFYPGEASTPITLQWKVIGSKNFHRLVTNETQESDVTQNGDYELSKGGGSGAAGYNSPSIAPEILPDTPGHNE
jgi:hypothetical protein